MKIDESKYVDLNLIKVSILEDDEEYRDSLKKILLKDERIWLYGEHDSSNDFMNAFRSPFRPDVCLVDIVLKEERTGIDCAKEIKDKYPEVHIIIMTSYPDTKYLAEAREIEADFIEKGTRGEILINKIVTSVKFRKEQLISLSSKKYGFDPIELINQMNTARNHISKLSEYQKRVLKLKLEGKSVNETAVILKMNPRTVRTHLRRALKKLELPDLLQYIDIE